ncbi:hypothetical protein SADUNF_Sadunf03G0142000 [Salix dunnii]|uniref:Uncharacterized protein n=1 Tax=Salix dunnii TaxID=1413687 RepID=A0A835N4V7_9ROSI|nr:hypothetical protein SADUNF_Sadunf03G0142000 [Salix dunnii]
MELEFRTRSFFILCCFTLLSMAPQSSPQHEDLDRPQPVMQGQVQGLNDRTGLQRQGESRNQYKGNHEIFHSIKGHRGEGGGANVAHRPKNREKSCALMSAEASSFLTTTMLYASLALILAFPLLPL